MLNSMEKSALLIGNLALKLWTPVTAAKKQKNIGKMSMLKSDFVDIYIIILKKGRRNNIR